MKHLKNKIVSFVRWIWLAIRRPRLIPKLVSYHLNKVEIYRIISITAGRGHAWVESSVGRIRKPIEGIPVNVRIAWNGEVENRINSIELPFVAPHV